MTLATSKKTNIDVDLSDLVIHSDKKRFIKAKRYSIFHATQHWGNMLLMVLFFFTGLEIAFGKHLIGDYVFTQGFHLVIGYIIMFWSIVYYAFVIYWDKNLYEVIPTPRDILDLLLIFFCAIGILDDKHYPQLHSDRPYNRRL